jgi:hypothetical protein
MCLLWRAYVKSKRSFWLTICKFFKTEVNGKDKREGGVGKKENSRKRAHIHI